MMTKTCSKCGETKPLAGFNKRKQANDGYEWQCKECTRRIQAEWRETHRLESRKYSKAWQEKNPLKVKLQSLRYYAKKRNHVACLVTDQQLEDAYTGCCAICGVPSVECKHSFHVEHNHITGELRGWLCAGCNKGLGMFQDNPVILRAAAQYIEDHQNIKV